MLTPTLYKRTISVQFYLRLAARNKRGYCPVRMTLRWHGQELQLDAGVLVLPERPGPNGQGVEALWDIKAQRALDGRRLTVKEMATVPTHPDTATNINAHLMSRRKTVEDTFYRLFDNGEPGRIPKAVLAAELVPGKEKAAPKAAPTVSRTFRQVLDEWKAENRNLAKDSLRKYDQLATMMEVWRPELRPDQVTQKVAKRLVPK